MLLYKTKKYVIATWSGGKDSCLATYRAMQEGCRVAYLANTVSRQYKRVGFHGTTDILIQKQAELAGISLLQQETTAEHYFEEFVDNLQRGITGDVVGVVFGDIHLDECFDRAQTMCRNLGVVALEPLWHRKQRDILEEFIRLGFEAVIVSTQASLLGKEWIGRKINQSFIRDISELPTIDPCGENGEFHTFVTNGPFFRHKIEILESRPMLRDNFWFLDIQKYRLC
ncbi:diphthine--ammonia ligase [Candidatus Gottesmanbacteria bacterium]|nr:diphthine--ammonia ligase [Candidatus Gottesmanbacteria bacterium]